MDSGRKWFLIFGGKWTQRLYTKLSNNNSTILCSLIFMFMSEMTAMNLVLLDLCGKPMIIIIYCNYLFCEIFFFLNSKYFDVLKSITLFVNETVQTI